jgi:hypothetical protein
VTVEMAAELAKAGMAAVTQIVDAIRDAHAGAIDPKDVLAALQDFAAELASNDRTADTALAKKFPG